MGVIIRYASCASLYSVEPIFSILSSFFGYMGSRRARRTVCDTSLSVVFWLICCRGIYDTDYLAYIRELLSLLPQYGLTAFVSMHQDVWSRYSGGSGAPAWTLELAGFDISTLEDTGSAWLKGQRRGGHTEAEQGLWPCGYHKLCASTMAYVFAFPLHQAGH